jgi:hypothetical protein
LEGDAESTSGRRIAADDSPKKSRRRFGASTKQPGAEYAQPSSGRGSRETGQNSPERGDPAMMGSTDERQQTARSTSSARHTGPLGRTPAQEQPVMVAEQPVREGEPERSEYGGQIPNRRDRTTNGFDDSLSESMEGSRPRSGKQKRQQAVDEIKAMLQSNPAFAKKPAHSKGDSTSPFCLTFKIRSACNVRTPA